MQRREWGGANGANYVARIERLGRLTCELRESCELKKLNFGGYSRHVNQSGACSSSDVITSEGRKSETTMEDPFCKFVRTLYSNANCSINLKWGTSPRFQLSRGVRQGCPVSPYLFLIAAQLLSSSLSSSALQGITVANKYILISQLADDTTLFLKDKSQIPVAIELIKCFSKASGLKLNLDKC